MLDANRFPAYGLGDDGAPVWLPSFAFKWYQNQVTKGAHLRDIARMCSKT